MVRFLKLNCKRVRCDDVFYDRSKTSFLNNYDNDDVASEYCREQRREATHACLEILRRHAINYLDRNLKYWIKARRDFHNHSLVKGECDGEFEIIIIHEGISSQNFCSYESWIRQCHPENTTKSCKTDQNDSNNLNNNILIDERFYHQDSHHLQLWNACVHSYGCPELKVRAR